MEWNGKKMPGRLCSPQIVKKYGINRVSIDRVAKKQQGSEILVAKMENNENYGPIGSKI